jgi:hypothetical protein
MTAQSDPGANTGTPTTDIGSPEQPGWARAAIAEMEIRQLANWYAHYMWTEDVDGYVSLFTDDAEIKQSSQQEDLYRVTAGREAIRTMITESFALRKPKTLTHSHIVNLISETEAIGSSYVQALDGANSYSDLLIARYDDQYQLQGGAWKFRVRHANIMKLTAGLKQALSQ